MGASLTWSALAKALNTVVQGLTSFILAREQEPWLDPSLLVMLGLR